MAEVKVKNGYLRIANSLYENLYFRNFSKRELLVISLILRLSYGFNKKTAIIKPKTWFSVCGLYQPDINKVLNSLITKNVIKSLGDNVYSLNKNYDDWSVGFPKNFNANKLNILKMLQQTEQNTIQNDSEILLDNDEETAENVEQNTIQNDSEILLDNDEETAENVEQNTIQNDSNLLSKSIVKNYDEKTDIEQNTIQNDSNLLSKSIVKNYDENAENEDDTSEIDPFKDNKDNKDIINIYKNAFGKGFDLYFNNQIVETFKKEYEKNFKKDKCYLDNFQIKKITDIAVENPDFKEKLPEIIKKWASIEFSDGVGNISTNTLILEGKWAAILNGEYDKYIKPASKEVNKHECNLGIPIV